MREQPVMPERPKRESTIENHLLKECLKRKWRCWKLSQRGLPDRLIVGPGIIAFAELKNENGKLSPLQARTLDYLNSNQHMAFTMFSKKEVDRFISLLESKMG